MSQAAVEAVLIRRSVARFVWSLRDLGTGGAVGRERSSGCPFGRLALWVGWMMVGPSGAGQSGRAGQDLRFAERGAGRSASDPHKSCAFFQDDWIDLHGKTVGEVRRRGQASEARRCFYPVECLPGLSSLKFSWSLGDLKSKLVPRSAAWCQWTADLSQAVAGFFRQRRKQSCTGGRAPGMAGFWGNWSSRSHSPRWGRGCWPRSLGRRSGNVAQVFW